MVGICDPNIFKNTFSKWNSALQAFIQSKGLNREESADLCQDAFVKLWQNCAKVEEEKAKSYLFTVANNLFIDQYRKAKSQIKFTRKISRTVEKEDGQFVMELEEFREKLENCLKSMNQNSKEVFMMHRFGDMSYKEISESLGIGVKAVEKRMHKALAHIANENILIKR